MKHGAVHVYHIYTFDIITVPKHLSLGHHLKHGVPTFTISTHLTHHNPKTLTIGAPLEAWGTYVYHIYTFDIITVPKHLPLGHHLKHGAAYVYHIYTFDIITVSKHLTLGHHLKHGAVHVYHIYTFDIITVPKHLPLGHHLKQGAPTFTISTHLISSQSQKLRKSSWSATTATTTKDTIKHWARFISQFNTETDRRSYMKAPLVLDIKDRT